MIPRKGKQMEDGVFCQVGMRLEDEEIIDIDIV